MFFLRVENTLSCFLEVLNTALTQNKVVWVSHTPTWPFQSAPINNAHDSYAALMSRALLREQQSISLAYC